VRNDSDAELLVELAKLFRRHGAEAFESLAARVSSPEFSEQLSKILLSTAKVGRSFRGSRARLERTQSSRDFRETLLALASTEPEKSEVLVRFYDGLVAKTFLPTLRDIQAFALDMGLSPVTANSRAKAIPNVIRCLMPLRTAEIIARLIKVKPVASASDRSLEGWSNIILRRDRT
jgi:hypothetical protein